MGEIVWNFHWEFQFTWILKMMINIASFGRFKLVYLVVKTSILREYQLIEDNKLLN